MGNEQFATSHDLTIGAGGVARGGVFDGAAAGGPAAGVVLQGTGGHDNGGGGCGWPHGFVGAHRAIFVFFSPTTNGRFFSECIFAQGRVSLALKGVF